MLSRFIKTEQTELAANTKKTKLLGSFKLHNPELQRSGTNYPILNTNISKYLLSSLGHWPSQEGGHQMALAVLRQARRHFCLHLYLSNQNVESNQGLQQVKFCIDGILKIETSFCTGDQMSREASKVLDTCLFPPPPQVLPLPAARLCLVSRTHPHRCF